MLSDKTYETIGRIWVVLFLVSLVVSIIGAGVSYGLARREKANAIGV